VAILRDRWPRSDRCGSNSGVEFLPSKQAVAGSNPVSRSNPLHYWLQGTGLKNTWLSRGCRYPWPLQDAAPKERNDPMPDPIWGDDPFQQTLPPVQDGTGAPEGFGHTVLALVLIGLALALVVGVAYLFVTHVPGSGLPGPFPAVTPSLAAPLPTPVPTLAPAPTAQPSPSPSPTQQPSPTPTLTPTAQPSPSPLPTLSPLPTVQLTPPGG
jgi:hypothetical protein